MFIVCPKCNFKRTVDSRQIPAPSTTATCPKCENKFRFRDPETGNFLENICLEFEDEIKEQTQKEEKITHVTGKIDDIPENESANKQDINLEKLSLDTQKTELENAKVSENTEKKVQDSSDEKPLLEEDIARKESIINDESNPLYAAKNNDTQNEEKSRKKQKANLPFNDSNHTQNYEMMSDDVPWEHPERYGLFGSLFQTIARVMLRAPAFFSTIHSQSSILRPALFYALLGLFQTLSLQLWLSTFTNNEIVQISPSLQESISTFTGPMAIVFAPFQAIIQLLIYSAFFYLAIRITNPDQADYNLILRVIAYASAPTILSIVPNIGPIIGLVWFAVNIFIGIKYALRLSWQKTALALSPIFILAVFLFMTTVAGLVSFVATK